MLASLTNVSNIDDVDIHYKFCDFVYFTSNYSKRS